MTTEPPPGLPGNLSQGSLLDPLAELALHPPGLNPDPLLAIQFVTGASGGTWHAIGRD